MTLGAPLALLLAAAVAPSAPANGVDEPPRRGTFVETTLGVFTTLGGTARASRAQPYLGLSVGRELPGRLTAFAALGLGSSSASCFATTLNGVCRGADSFGAAFAELGLSAGAGLADRTLLSLKVVAGLTHLSPGPVPDGAGVPDHLTGLHAGAGLALDYDTHLDHFAVGLDALLRYTVARYTPAGEARQTLGVPSFALLPRVRYVF